MIDPKSIQSPCFLIDGDGQIEFASQSFREVVDLHRVEGRRYSDLLLPDDRRRWEWIQGRIWSGEGQIEDHHYFSDASAVVNFVRSEGADGIPRILGLVIISNTNEACSETGRGTYARKKATKLLFKGLSAARLRLEGRIRALEAKLAEARKTSETDAPTGLRNRIGLETDLQNEITRNSAEGATYYLAIVDLDDFKQVNDLYGHPVGDRLLKIVGRRLKASGSVVSAARIGGDEFALLIKGPDDDAGRIVEILQRIADRIWRPVVIDGVQLRISGSAGVAAVSSSPPDLQETMRHADTALIDAKQNGKDQVRLYDEAVSEKSRRRDVLQNDIQNAIGTDALKAVYQPVLPSREGGYVGVEVLSRWSHPEFGNVPPEEFIRLATECGLLSELDLSTVEMALRELRPLFETRQLNFVSFNLDPSELAHKDYIDRFVDIVRRSDFPSGRICIEVTEEGMIADFETARDAVAKLKQAGVIVALDDYGTGYSNLRALLDLPVDVIKIDQSLISDIADEERAMQAVLSVVNLARVFSAELVAEGVETAEQAAVAQALGCHYLQGFGISMPLPIDRLVSWLQHSSEDSRAGPGRLPSNAPGNIRLVS